MESKIVSGLEKLGFSQNEIKVYLTLNSKGAKTAGKIAKLAGIDRSSCYNSLQNLLKKGLISYAVDGNVKCFQATGPRNLQDYIKEQVRIVDEIMPALQDRHKTSKIEGNVRLFKGIKGVKAIFLDIARDGKDNFVFGSEGQLSDELPEFAKQFDRMKRENSIRTKLIIRNGRKETNNKTTSYRYLDVAESPAVTNIYGEKIAIIIWTEEPEGIIIENKAAAMSYKSYFDILWKVAKQK